MLKLRASGLVRPEASFVCVPVSETMVGKKAIASVETGRRRMLGRSGCRKCGGTGWEILRCGLSDAARRCGCRVEKTRRFWTEEVGIPERLLGCELQGWLDRRQLPARARRNLCQYVRQFPSTAGTLLLFGEPEQVPAQIAAALLREVQRLKRCSVYYIDARRRRESEGAGLFGPEQDEDLESYARAELVIVDGLFAADVDEAARIKWAGLLHQRYLRQHATILVGNGAAYRLLHGVLDADVPCGSREVRTVVQRLVSDATWCWVTPQPRLQALADRDAQPPGEVA